MKDYPSRFEKGDFVLHAKEALIRAKARYTGIDDRESFLQIIFQATGKSLFDGCKQSGNVRIAIHYNLGPFVILAPIVAKGKRICLQSKISRERICQVHVRFEMGQIIRMRLVQNLGSSSERHM